MLSLSYVLGGSRELVVCYVVSGYIWLKFATQQYWFTAHKSSRCIRTFSEQNKFSAYHSETVISTRDEEFEVLGGYSRCRCVIGTFFWPPPYPVASILFRETYHTHTNDIKSRIRLLNNHPIAYYTTQ